VEQNKNKLGLGILIGVLVTLVICLSAFIIYDKVLSDDSNQIEETDKNQNNNKENASDNKTELPEFDISKFDTTKEAINGTDGMAYEPITNDTSTSAAGLSIKLDKNKRSVTIAMDWSKYGSLWSDGHIGVGSTETIEYEVVNFTKNIKEAYIAGFTSSSGFETAFYIMEDGTVEYTPIVSALKNNDSLNDKNLKSYGKIENVSGVVKLISATGYYPNNEQAVTSGTYILGIKSDGSFYDLSKIINTNNNY